jgi:hypothetical protein
MMNVLYFTTSIPLVYGGAGVHIEYLYKKLRAWPSRVRCYGDQKLSAALSQQRFRAFGVLSDLIADSIVLRDRRDLSGRGGVEC